MDRLLRFQRTHQMLSIKNSITETESLKIKQAESDDRKSSLNDSPNLEENKSLFIKIRHRLSLKNPETKKISHPLQDPSA